MRAVFLFLALILSSFHFAQAQNQRPEFFYQATEGEQLINTHLHYGRINHDGKGGGDDIDLSLTNLKINYEYGLMDQLAIYANIGYGYSELADFLEFKGLDPINLGAKYRIPFKSGELFSKVNIGIGLLGDADCQSGSVISCKRTDNSVNASIQLGYVLHFQEAFLGFALDYGLLSTKGEASGTSDFDKRGALLLTAFYERVFAEKIWGASVQYALSSIGGVHDSTPYGGIFFADLPESSKTQYIQTKTYTRLPISETISFIGGLYYELIVKQDNVNISGGNGFGANLGLRLTLN